MSFVQEVYSEELKSGARSCTVKVSELSGISVSDARHFRHRIRVNTKLLHPRDERGSF